MNTRRLTLSVEELNEYVRRSLAGDPMLHGIRIRGEISNFKRHVSGHWYFSLKDSQSAINCAMFRVAAATVGFRPKDGDQVVLTGNVGLYTKTGAYQFYADAMEQEGVGELYLRMEALKQQLTREGLFDASLKKPLPLLPKGVGIITSGTGAVIHDITRIIWRRFPAMPLFLYPVAVQGQSAVEQISRALSVMDQVAGVDVIILGRGGGSMEDLWCFNDEKVARAIAACQRPVISAVGHETDFTIADFVADVRAATPSAAAEIAVPEQAELFADCNAFWMRIQRSAQTALATQRAHLTAIQERLKANRPQTMLAAIAIRTQELIARMNLLATGSLATKEHLLSQLSLRIHSASPDGTLKRGYAMVLQNELPVQSIELLDSAKPFSVVFHDGRILAKALQTAKEETP